MRTLLFLLALLAVPSALAQSADDPVRATTEDGRAILVYGDGTWRLDRRSPPPAAEVVDLDLSAGSSPAPPPPPAPPPSSVRTLTSASGTYALTYDPTVWSRPRNRVNEETEFELSLPFSGGYAMSIYEAFPSTNKQVRDFVLTNAELGTGHPVSLLSERPFRVPGGEGIQLEFEGMAENGVEFVFITSVFGTDEGALQVTTFTSQSAAERHRATMLRFHDGIRLLKNGE